MVKMLGLSLIAAVALSLPLCAQQGSFRVDVPFEFMVGNSTVPAGTYVVKLLNSPCIQLEAGQRTYLFPTSSNENHPYDSKVPALSFHRYGDQYFLARVRAWSDIRTLPTSRTERELNRPSVASARPERAEVLLAAR